MKPSNHNLDLVEIRKKAKMLNEICKFCGCEYDSVNFKAVCKKCEHSYQDRKKSKQITCSKRFQHYRNKKKLKF